MERFLIEKPDIESLKKKYTVVDLHCHTEASHDCNMSITRLAAKIKSLGVGVAITDHDEIKGALALRKNYPDIFMIPGIEATSRQDKDLLLYFNSFKDLKTFYDRHLAPNKKKHKTNLLTFKTTLDTDYILDIAGDYNALRVLPHPLMRGKGIYRSLKRKKDFSVLRHVDGIEVLNAGQKVKANIRSFTWANIENKPFTGGSDSHISKTFANSVTLSTAETPESFLESIRKKKNRVVGHTNNFSAELSSFGSIIRNKLKYVRKKERVEITRI